MAELYISKWWGNYAGTCDDSLLLLDYFGEKNIEKFEFREILEDIHLYSPLKSNTFKNSDLYFELRKDYIPHFDMEISVLLDLSVIVLECKKNRTVSIRDLDASSKYDKIIEISTSKSDVELLRNGLEFFINNAESFVMAEFLSKDELIEFSNECEEVKNELNSFLK